MGVKLKDFVEFNPARNVKRGQSYPYIDMSALPEYRRDIEYVTYRDFTGGGSRFRNGDTLFPRMQLCLENGKSALVTDLECDGWGSTEFIVMSPKDRSDTDFVYYITRLPEFRDYAIKNMNGTTRQRVSWQALSGFDYNFPEKPFRKKAGDVLKSLDDLILKNSKFLEDLEQISEFFFRSWFVNFEPVCAKKYAKAVGLSPAQGERAAMAVLSGLCKPKEISKNFTSVDSKLSEKLSTMNKKDRENLQYVASLFPGTFQQTEWGVLPEGWMLESLDNHIEFLNGLALQKYPSQKSQSGLPVLKIAQLKKGIAEGGGFASKEIPSKYKIKNGDLIFSWSASLMVKIWCGGPAALNQHLFKVSSQTYPTWFQWLWCKHHLKTFQAIAASKATTMGHIQRKHLSAAKIFVPPKESLKYFDQFFQNIENQFVDLNLTNKKIEELRDQLLPKLLAGKIDLSSINLNKDKKQA